MTIMYGCDKCGKTVETVCSSVEFPVGKGNRIYLRISVVEENPPMHLCESCFAEAVYEWAVGWVQPGISRKGG